MVDTKSSFESIEQTINVEERSLLDFYHCDSANLLEKCSRFQYAIEDLKEKQLYQTMYRVSLTSGLDHHITVFNAITGQQEKKICFDSNSYFGLHHHPRVIAAVKKALNVVGYGTPSAQLLCGTNRYLQELEETVSQFHGREDAIIFPSGYAANMGTISALVRKKDAIFRDRFSHASIHDVCRSLHTRYKYIYPHQDLQKLELQLQDYSCRKNAFGKLIITDGVFSMHGRLAPLPQLVDLAKKYHATLMVDEAHSVGVIGTRGRGLEDHFNLPESIDVLMGTFSKAPGTAGGYVCGSKELITYLRFFANAAVFTASLPAANCAGITEAFKIMEEEPQHRELLWKNIFMLAPALRSAGFIVSDPESPILTVFMGSNKLLWAFSRELFLAGIKCGNVSYPAVPHGEAILRLAVNARHTAEDLDRSIEIMIKLGKKFGILNKSAEEILELSKYISFAEEK